MRTLLAAALIFAFGCTQKKDHVIHDTKSPRFLYVLNATEGTQDGEDLVLEGVPSALYFSDRPSRLAGHMTLKQFVKEWNKEELDKMAPQATLSLTEGDSTSFELKDPSVEGTTITFKAKKLKGDVPSSFKSCALFIDTESKSDVAFREDFHPNNCTCSEHL